MKLELEFQSADDIVNFFASLGPVGRKLVGATDKVQTAAAAAVNTLYKEPSAAVTPDKQEKARASTGKVKEAGDKVAAATLAADAPATPEAALVAALSYEKDLGPLFARAVVHNKPAALAAVGGKPAHEIPREQWADTMALLHVVLDGVSEADTPALDYERDVVPKAKLAQAKDKAALAEILKAHGGVEPETGKVSGRFLKREALAPVVKALDALLGA